MVDGALCASKPAPFLTVMLPVTVITAPAGTLHCPVTMMSVYTPDAMSPPVHVMDLSP